MCVCEKNPGRKPRGRSSSARSEASEPAESVLAALGIEGNSKCVRVPGWKAQEKVAKSVFFEKGDLYKCPCGWCPDTEKKSWVHEATRHSKRCQGREKPKMAPETKAQVYGRTSVIIAARKRKRVIKEYSSDGKRGSRGDTKIQPTQNTRDRSCASGIQGSANRNESYLGAAQGRHQPEELAQ